MFATISGIFWIVGITLSLSGVEPRFIKTIFFILGACVGGYYTSIEAFKTLLAKKLNIDFLMLFAAVGAAFLGRWSDASLLLFLFSLGHALEHYAMDKARKSIQALTELVSHTALLKRNNSYVEVNVEELQIGDTIIVKPNTTIPADGIVVKGESVVNQAPITGESTPSHKYPVVNYKNIKQVLSENTVFAGTINGPGAIDIRITKRYHDTTLSRLIKLVKEAESQKSPTQHLADKFERFYVPFVVLLVFVLMLAFLIINETFEQSFYRAMSVLIAASPCALAISTPSAILAGIARAAKEGVLIKGGKPLEDLGNLDVIAFDKTGTLTEGKPQLTRVIPYSGSTKEEMLRVASAVESLSDHPLSKAIVDGALKRLGNNPIPIADNFVAITARGVSADVAGEKVYLGNRRLLEEITKHPVPSTIDSSMKKIEDQGHTAMILYKENRYLGILGVMDVARTEAKDLIQNLREIGIKDLIMLSGDNQLVVDSVSSVVGLNNSQGNLLPEDKVHVIENYINQNYKVAMVGDGVNDAPAMAKSTVSIAMGAAGSDVALETADIALMSDNLKNISFAIRLSKKTNRIIKQNLTISLGMVAILLPLTMLGIAEIGPAVVGHEGSTVLVVLNALRLLKHN